MWGCGESPENVKRASVRGVVTVDGEPLPKGKIVFAPDGAHSAQMATVPVSNGQFDVPDNFGPIIGAHRIEIISTDDGGYSPDDEAAMERWIAGGRKPIKIVRIPEEYNQDGKLKAEVTEDGPNEFKFELASNSKSRR
jgi:hypothetical protein